MNKSIKAGIVGATGYTGGELIRLLVHHPNVEIDFLYSRSKNDVSIATVHDDLLPYSNLTFTNKINENTDIVFLCLPHGETRAYLQENTFSKHTKIIDLSNDFRLKAKAEGFVYGLPELNKSEIKSASKIANPGCFATSIQLALLPLANSCLLKDDVHVSAITGSTGAGNSLTETSHFTWRNNNISTYKVFTHQHLGEILQSLNQLQNNFDSDVNFVPYRGNFTRGILATCYTKYSGTLEEAKALFQTYYKDEPFVKIADKTVHLKQVVNTNYCYISLEVTNDKLLINSIIDNLLKGASGQAIQNMNLMMGWNETTGLQLKGSYY